MSTSDLGGTTALVTGASRGFGRATAIAFHQAGAKVVAVARRTRQLERLRGEPGDAVTVAVADATDPVVAVTLVEQYRPKRLILSAGAQPLPHPIQHQTWQTFSRNWEVDARHAFH